MGFNSAFKGLSLLFPIIIFVILRVKIESIRRDSMGQFNCFDTDLITGDHLCCIQGVPGGMCQTSGGCSLC